MYSENELKKLIELSKKGTEQLEIELKKFDMTMAGVLKKAPEKDIPVVEKLQALTSKAIELHKQGKTQEANKITEEIKNLI